MPKLTKQLIESNGKKEKKYIIWDTEIKGFGCAVQPSGKKVYIFHYRLPKSRKKEYLTIGVHGPLTPDMARDLAKGWTVDIIRGIDIKKPNKIIIEQKEEDITFNEFLVIFTERHRKDNKKTSIRSDNSNIKNWIIPFFGTKILNQISRKDILSFKDMMKKRPGAYNKCFNTIRSLFNRAKEWEYLMDRPNPCTNVTKYPEKKMERFLSKNELQKLEEILKSENITKNFSIYAINSIKLLIYTGCRKTEILSLKWEDVHLEDNYFLLREAKEGERIVALNEISKNILCSMAQRDDNPYVFPSTNNKMSFINITRLWNRVRILINCEDVRIHDIRHSFASFAIKKGIDIFRIAKLLGHKDVKTTMRYAHISKDDMVDASNTVAEMFGK